MQSAADNEPEFTAEEYRLVALLEMEGAVVQALGFQWGDMPVDRPIPAAVECLRGSGDAAHDRLEAAERVQSATDAYLTESTPARFTDAVDAYSTFNQLGEDSPCPRVLH